MKKILFVLFLLFIGSSCSAYVDMSQVVQRANDLNMKTQDYAFAMAITGALTGSIFGLFLWKAK